MLGKCRWVGGGSLSGWLTHGGHQLTHLQAKPGLAVHMRTKAGRVPEGLLSPRRKLTAPPPAKPESPHFSDKQTETSEGKDLALWLTAQYHRNGPSWTPGAQAWHPAGAPGPSGLRSRSCVPRGRTGAQCGRWAVAEPHSPVTPPGAPRGALLSWCHSLGCGPGPIHMET